MLIKWIQCKVSSGQKQLFSKAQEEWAALEKVKGFIGQAGGWSLTSPDEACIVSLWQSQESYEYFMKQEHDEIFLNSGQKSTYKRISVSLFEGPSFTQLSSFEHLNFLFLSEEKTDLDETTLCLNGKNKKNGRNIYISISEFPINPIEKGTSVEIEKRWTVLKMH
ncbi:YdbC family protein [Metabacillus sp. RGM 3146]|uniref:YdbC family protein n=1 Tax=Metabacillus sp. RGM 3146 TaxID=3401092 RepID=UPI003B9A282A